MNFRRRTRTPEAPEEGTVETRSEATLAREYSESRLQTVQEAWPEVTSIAETFRKMRMDNHFAARIKEAHQP